MPVLKKKLLLILTLIALPLFGASELFACCYLTKDEMHALNRHFNSLLRESKPSYWGNWSLDTEIKPGAIGVVNTTTGTFHPAGRQLKNISITSEKMSSKMKLATKSVIGPQIVTFSAKDKIKKLTANTNLKWRFVKRGAILSQWNLASEDSLKQPFEVIKSNMDLLKLVAEDMEMYNKADDGITQGFGVITGVLMAKSGMNVASLSDNTHWSISGQASALKSILGYGSAKASYSSAGGDSNVVSVLWPSTPNTTTDKLVPVAYTFTSINGTQLMPFWTQEINSFEIVFNNHGSYIVKTTLTYQTPHGEKKKHQNIGGFTKRVMSDIPLNATSLKLELEFVNATSNKKEYYHWPTPLGTWSNGMRHIDIHGWWPEEPTFSIRENKVGTVLSNLALNDEYTAAQE